MVNNNKKEQKPNSICFLMGEHSLTYRMAKDMDPEPDQYF